MILFPQYEWKGIRKVQQKLTAWEVNLCSFRAHLSFWQLSVLECWWEGETGGTCHVQVHISTYLKMWYVWIQSFVLKSHTDCSFNKLLLFKAYNGCYQTWTFWGVIQTFTELKKFHTDGKHGQFHVLSLDREEEFCYSLLLKLSYRFNYVNCSILFSSSKNHILAIIETDPNLKQHVTLGFGAAWIRICNIMLEFFSVKWAQCRACSNLGKS